MKKKPAKNRPTPKSKPARKPKSKARPKATPKPKAAPRRATVASKRKPAKAKAKPNAKAKAKKPNAKAKPRAKPAAKLVTWTKFVESHGVVLASARGPVPCVAEAIAGEPIVGSWWSHPKAPVIFDALSLIDDADDIRCFKLIDHKITFVHKRLWPALAKLAHAGLLEAERVASIQQEHMPTGEHRTFTTPFPDWVPDDVARSAEGLTVDDAKTQLGGWV